MMNALWIASTGMETQQLFVDNISNNLANVNTVGFKKSRIDFEDLLYQNLRVPGSASSLSTQVPTGIQMGHGVRPVATQKIFSMGNLQQTTNALDLAIEGDGFFQVITPNNGQTAYTRDGSFKLDKDGNIVTSNGYLLEPQVVVPADTVEIYISADGIVSVIEAGNFLPTEVGNIELTRFVNPAGLQALGNNLFSQTNASGDPQTGVPGENGAGVISQGFVEMSNVSVVEEMVNMIVAQRDYELNSKAIQTSDEMLQLANNLKR
ncbi:MAG: flagellar basal-body rod protein FlgG [Deltaproteobacteria bacterium]|nr:flagellar basal-body rod protein FlgG [Deltaproteobacteria bacterium]